MKTRYDHIDIAKGFGILFIVLGHSHFTSYKEFGNIVFSFHVPLFFILSGVFYNSDQSTRSFIFKKIDSILKPYFVILLLLGGSYFFLKNQTLQEFISYSSGVVYATGDTIPWVALWFLPHLFVVFLFSKVIFYFISEKFLFLISLFLLGLGYKVDDYFYRRRFDLFGYDIELPGLPFSLDVIFITSFYFGICFEK